MTEKLTIRRPDDMHCHFRSSPVLEKVLPFTAQHFARAIVMPNTRPVAILTSRDVVRYRSEIYRALDVSRPDFEPLMTIEIRDNTTPEMVREAFKIYAIAGKVYPLGATTNSDEGLRDFFSPQIRAVFETMQNLGMVLLLHGEIIRPRRNVVERELEFLPIAHWIAENFPRLRIVFEHVSTKDGIDLVRGLPNMAATITAHHLCLTIDDVIGDGIRPHNMCMPVPKDYDDRDALIEAATSGYPQFFFGSDSAPHLRQKKECAKGACGVFSAPVLLPVLAEVFEKAGKLDKLEDFVSRFGAEFYGLPLNMKTVTLRKGSWTVPAECNGIVPFKAGQELAWQVV